MRIITKLSELDGTLHPAVNCLVRQRLEMLAEYGDEEMGRFIIPEAEDSMAAVEHEVGFPFAEPAWEWVIDHGNLYEAPFILSDDGYGHVLIVRDAPGIDPALLTLLRAYAEPANCPDSTPI